jgi:ABC-type polysaccharide/polyol phosphate export permease
MAMAAKRPMITTTIMISTSVKADWERVFIILLWLLLLMLSICIGFICGDLALRNLLTSLKYHHD